MRAKPGHCSTNESGPGCVVTSPSSSRMNLVSVRPTVSQGQPELRAETRGGRAQPANNWDLCRPLWRASPPSTSQRRPTWRSTSWTRRRWSTTRSCTRRPWLFYFLRRKWGINSTEIRWGFISQRDFWRTFSRTKRRPLEPGYWRWGGTEEL